MSTEMSDEEFEALALNESTRGLVDRQLHETTLTIEARRARAEEARLREELVKAGADRDTWRALYNETTESLERVKCERDAAGDRERWYSQELDKANARAQEREAAIEAERARAEKAEAEMARLREENAKLRLDAAKRDESEATLRRVTLELEDAKTRLELARQDAGSLLAQRDRAKKVAREAVQRQIDLENLNELRKRERDCAVERAKDLEAALERARLFLRELAAYPLPLPPGLARDAAHQLGRLELALHPPPPASASDGAGTEHHDAATDPESVVQAGARRP